MGYSKSVVSMSFYFTTTLISVTFNATLVSFYELVAIVHTCYTTFEGYAIPAYIILLSTYDPSTPIAMTVKQQHNVQ